MGVGCAVLTKM
jgi:hypothetical protein